ncbi:pyruvate kinase [Tanacetum coccineum]|uniref:Pyruvate kinase n=1 Tax=Tanacetum coccineum TaxID=301880 RepID=A0ABQ4ZPX0_9ASTR
MGGTGGDRRGEEGHHIGRRAREGQGYIIRSSGGERERRGKHINGIEGRNRRGTSGIGNNGRGNRNPRGEKTRKQTWGWEREYTLRTPEGETGEGGGEQTPREGMGGKNQRKRNRTEQWEAGGEQTGTEQKPGTDPEVSSVGTGERGGTLVTGEDTIPKNMGDTSLFSRDVGGNTGVLLAGNRFLRGARGLYTEAGGTQAAVGQRDVVAVILFPVLANSGCVTGVFGRGNGNPLEQNGGGANRETGKRGGGTGGGETGEKGRREDGRGNPGGTGNSGKGEGDNGGAAGGGEGGGEETGERGDGGSEVILPSVGVASRCCYSIVYISNTIFLVIDSSARDIRITVTTPEVLDNSSSESQVERPFGWHNEAIAVGGYRVYLQCSLTGGGNWLLDMVLLTDVASAGSLGFMRGGIVVHDAYDSDGVMVIDKSWTRLGRHEKAFYTGLKKVSEDCKPLVNSVGIIKGPCKSCRLVSWVSIKNLSCHITNYGFDPSYKTWIHHGEPDLPPTSPVIDNTRQAQISDMTAFEGVTHFCPVCNTSRWKDSNTPGKKVPKKVLRYFPIIPRLQRLYKSSHTAKEMTWHVTGKCTEPEPRNVRLGLAADGFNPFGNLSQAYSMWPVILTTYNLPLWLCMKESFFMLTLLIPGPKSLGKDIDVYLRPLIDDLKVLWALEGVETIDVATGQKFNMRAMVLWTINDFPARSSLSRWSGQGVKLPDGFGSNFKHKVTNNDTNIMGLKSHDFHIMMQRLLPYGLQQYLPVKVAKPIIELCSFFKKICTATLMEDDMLKAQSNVVDIMCNLELIYPPTFFDIMIHLVIYLALEALEGGTIHPWWMYPFERFMKKLKNYVRNKAKPEVCKLIGLRSVIRFDYQELKKVIWYVLHNIPEIDTYRSQFKSRDERRTTQNSGICSPGGKDGEMYYGQLQEILEFSYLLFKVVLFRVKWFDTSNNGRRVQHYVIRNNMTQIWAKVNRLKMINTFSQHKSNKSSTLKICPDDHPTGRSSNM